MRGADKPWCAPGCPPQPCDMCAWLRPACARAGFPAGLPSGGRTIPTRARRQHAGHYLRALDNLGSWEGNLAAAAAPSGAGAALPPFTGPPEELWEALGHEAPEVAELASHAADVASSAKYFEARVSICVER